MSDSPDTIVAKQIATELVQRGLLQKARSRRFAEELAEGRIQIDDWKLLADAPENALTDSSDVK
jgi:hypothetical protein